MTRWRQRERLPIAGFASTVPNGTASTSAGARATTWSMPPRSDHGFDGESAKALRARLTPLIRRKFDRNVRGSCDLDQNSEVSYAAVPLQLSYGRGRPSGLEGEYLPDLAAHGTAADASMLKAQLVSGRESRSDTLAWPRLFHQSAERHADATARAPHDVAGIRFGLWQDDQRELVGDRALRSDVERGSRVGQIVNDAAEGHVPDPDQSH